MTPCIEEAQRLLRLARRDYQTCAILASHPEAQIATRTLAWVEALLAKTL